jgi:hypothetical protein
LKVSPLEQLDPLEYSEKYHPNKYGIILQEHLFIGEETSLSLFLRLRIGGMIAAGGKGKDVPETEENPPLNQRVTILELFEGDKLIYNSVGSNHGLIPHINLQNNGEEFLLVYRYDLRHWPEAIH